MRPELFGAGEARLAELARTAQIVDGFSEAAEELFRIDFPYIAPGSPEYRNTLRRYAEVRKIEGTWVYFPWRNCLVHLPSSADFLRLRTARNQFLITAEEQRRFYSARVGVAGLSVGSSIVHAIALSGGAGYMRIGDPDRLSITNLNRLSASVCDLGMSKTTMAARKLYETNPYQEVDARPNGFDSRFFEGERLDLFIEEMDNLYLKIVARLEARELGIPVVMATDNGDNTIIDVERFDLEPDRPLFHGDVDEDVLRGVPTNPSLSERIRVAGAIVGPNTTPRSQQSLMQVGTRLPSWPQLGNAATLSGAAVSYVARRIVTGAPMPSGRYYLSMDSVLDPGFHDPGAQTEREEQAELFVDSLRLLFGGSA